MLDMMNINIVEALIGKYYKVSKGGNWDGI